MNDFSHLDNAATDEEWEAAYLALTDYEQIAYVKKRIAELRNDPKGLTPEQIDKMEAGILDFQKLVEAERIAIREEAIARARVDRSADALLAAMPDRKRGN